MKYAWYAVAVVAILFATANIWIHFATMTTVSEVVIQDKERIFDLVGEGYPIDRQYVITNTGKRVMQYWLKS
jgi:hypothetical protein